MTLEGSRPTLPSSSWFSDWFKRAWEGAYVIVFNSKWLDFLPVLWSIGILSGVAAFGVALVKGLRPFLFYVNDIGHLIILLSALFLFLPRLGVGRPTVPREKNDPADVAVNQFENWLYALVVLWLVFYLDMFFVDLPSVASSTRTLALAQWADVISPYLNVMSAIPFIGLYVALSRPSVDEPGWGIGRGIWLALGSVTLVWALQTWAGTQGKFSDAQMAAGIANGLLVGITQALVLGKLDSAYIRLSSPTIFVLYLYALIQPLFPYVFQSGLQTSDPLRLAIQQGFVAVALIMKATLILSLGRLIDTGRLHFYMSNVRWLDAHAATLLAQHDKARMIDGQSRARLPLFSFVHPAHPHVVLRIAKLDARVHLGLLNSWLGIPWDIRDLRAQSVTISDAVIPVKRIVVEIESLRISDSDRHLFGDVFVDFAIPNDEFVEQLRQDPKIGKALQSDSKSTDVTFVLKGLTARVAMVEQSGLTHSRMPIEPVDGGDGLVYECTVNLDRLR